MAEPKNLIRGVDSAAPTADEENHRIAVLRATIYHYLPQFAAAVQQASQADNGQRLIILHQDAFAAGYDDDEYTLPGMAIKYAGFHGATVTVVGEKPRVVLAAWGRVAPGVATAGLPQSRTCPH